MKKWIKTYEDSFRDYWDKNKTTNFWIIVVTEEEEKNKEYEKMYDGIVENSPNIRKEIATQIPEDQSPIQNILSEKHPDTY